MVVRGVCAQGKWGGARARACVWGGLCEQAAHEGDCSVEVPHPPELRQLCCTCEPHRLAPPRLAAIGLDNANAAHKLAHQLATRVATLLLTQRHSHLQHTFSTQMGADGCWAAVGWALLQP